MSSPESDWLSCSDLVGCFDAGLELFFIAFEKINSWFGFTLRSFRMACSMGMRCFVWIWTISVSILDIGQFLGSAWWSIPQWQHLTSVLVHLSLLCPWLLHLANVAIVSRQLFTVCHIYDMSCSSLVFHNIRKLKFLLVLSVFLWISVFFFLWKSVGVE